MFDILLNEEGDFALVAICVGDYFQRGFCPGGLYLGGGFFVMF